MSQISNYSKDSIVGVVGKITKLISGYGSLWLLTDILSDTGYGGYVTAFAVLSLLTVLAQVGLRQATVQRISELSTRNEKAIPRHAGAAVTWVGIIASVVTIFTLFASQFIIDVFNQTVINWVQALVFVIPGMAVLPICGGIYRGLEQVSISIILEQILVRILRLFGLVFVWFYWQEPIGVALAIGLAYYFPIAVVAVKTRGWQYLNLGGLSLSHLKFSGYLLINSIASRLLKETDVLLLASLGTLSGTGGYDVAWKFAIIARYGDQILTNTQQPRISNYLAEDNITDLREEFNRVKDLSVIATIPVLIIVILFGPLLLSIFGNYESQYKVLAILTVGAAINASFGSIGQILLMGKRGKLVLINTVISLGGNILLNIFLIPRYGTFGAAIATVSTVFFLTNLVGVLQVRYLMNIKTFDLMTMAVVSLLTTGVILIIYDLIPRTAIAVSFIVLGGILAYRRSEFIHELIGGVQETLQKIYQRL